MYNQIMEKLKPCSFYFNFLIKKYSVFLFTFISVVVFTNGFFINNVYAEDITEDTHWVLANSPYIITDDIYILNGATLIIDPGVIVKFDYGTNMIVDGKLEALGLENDGMIYFTSYYDDTLGGDTDGEEYYCYFNTDDEGNNIEPEICDPVDDSPYSGDWGVVLIRSTTSKSILNNVVSRYSNDGLFLMNGGSVDSTNFSSDKEIYIYNSLDNSFSGLDIPSIEISEDSEVSIIDSTILNQEGSSVLIYSDSSLDIKNSNISGYNGFEIYQNSSLSATDLSIECESDGISVFDNSSLNLSGGDINCGNIGVYVFGDSTADITGVKINGASEAGLMAHSNLDIDAVKITKSEITGNENGFIVYGSDILANQNSIHDNTSTGAMTYDSDQLTLFNYDFTNNFWGDASGPIHSLVSSGLVGDILDFDNILYLPFLTTDPLIEKVGLSNVLFIPGFQASRIYKMNNILGLEYEDKLWEPNASGDIPDIFMSEIGESINQNIYTRDLINEVTVFGVKTIDVYKSFFNKLNEMVSDNKIAMWKAVAYDWRLSPLDIVNRGIEKANGSISYNEELTEDQIPYIIDQLQKLRDSSSNGKVTIVTHSNGGLVSKALIDKLVEMKNNEESNLVDYIDNLIMVAPPLIGTPKATFGILHGYSQGMGLNILLGRKKARDFGQNLPGAYGLIPSEEYLSSVDTNLIVLDESLDKLNNWRSIYDESINTFEEFQSFLLGTEGNRAQSSYDDLVNPTILNETVLNKAKLLHSTIDNLEIPSTIQVYQIAGTGLPTAYNLEYKSKSECIIFINSICLKKKNVLSSDVGITSDGDGTVIAGSALFGEGNDYYLNLSAHNENNSNKDHLNIFEVPVLFDFINNIMKSDPNLPEYITVDKPAPADYTVLKMRSPVAIDIYNADGLHTGIVENNDPDLDIIEEGIPNSSYIEIGEEKYIIVPKEGDYKLKLTGLSGGIFTLEQEQIINDLPGESVIWRDIPTTSFLRGEVDITDNNLATNISLDIDNDGIFESVISPSAAKEETNDKKNHSNIIGSIIPIIDKQDSMHLFSFKEDIDKDKLHEDNEITLEKSVGNKEVRQENNLKKDIQRNKNTKNNLSASSRLINNIPMGNGTSFIIIISSIVVILLAIKFIFKVK